MSVINFADNIKVGSSQVQAVYSGSTLVWPSLTDLWTFNDPVVKTTITDLNVGFIGDSANINWGDGVTNALTSDININHTYLADGDLLFTVDSSLGEFPVASLSLGAGTPVNIIVDWGDGSPNYVKNGLSNGFPVIHTYAVDGVYEVKVSGSSEYIDLNESDATGNLISVQNLGTFGIADRPNMFKDCINLASVNFGNYVTSIGDNAFFNCPNLTSISIPDSITSIGNYGFAFCGSLASITIPDSVTSIGDNAFILCYNLATVTLPTNVSFISIEANAFALCSGLTSINIPDSVTSIGDFAFAACNLLATIDLSQPKSVIDGATDIFLDTASPLTLNVPTGTTGWVDNPGQSIGGNTNVTVNLV